MPTLLNKLYTLKEIDDRESIEILTGKYQGVIYQYGRVQFHPNEKKKTMTISFDYAIFENPHGFQLEDNDVFYKIMGDILSELIDMRYCNKDYEPDLDYSEDDDGDVIEGEYEGEIVEQ